MRVLLPEPGDLEDLHTHYAAGWLDRGGIRGCMLASVDGAVAVAGRSRRLQTPGDTRVYAALRDLADVVVVGSATARLEGYRPARLSADRRARRRALGLAETLPIAVVSRSLRLDTAGPLFADPAHRPLVLTAGVPAPAGLAEVADIVRCGSDRIDWAAVRRELAGRGWRRVLAEGGPTVLADLARSGGLDELCLSISPLLAGPGAERILAGPAWDRDPLPLRLAAALEEDGALFLRYTRR